MQQPADMFIYWGGTWNKKSTGAWDSYIATGNSVEPKGLVETQSMGTKSNMIYMMTLSLSMVFAPKLHAQSITIDTNNNHWGNTGNVSSPITAAAVIIPDGQVLTIDPGVEVIMTDHVGMIGVESGGKLIVNGTKSNPVVIRPSGADWGGLFLESSEQSRITGCHIQRGATYAVYVTGTARIKDCVIDSSPYGLATEPGITIDLVVENTLFIRAATDLSANGRTLMANCTFYSPKLAGLIMVNSGSPTIVNNLLIAPATAVGVYGGTPTITHNLFSGFNWNGGSNNISADAMVMDTAGHDFRLKPFSPAIDAGDPSSPYGNEPSPNGCRVNIGAYGNTSEAAVSRIEIISPNGGESWQAGETRSITWKSSRFSGPKALAYSLNNGLTWSGIDTIEQDSGEYSWSIPHEVNGSVSCKVKISNVNCDAVTDQSDAVFSISKSNSVIRLHSNPTRPSRNTHNEYYDLFGRRMSSGVHGTPIGVSLYRDLNGHAEIMLNLQNNRN